jgi:hypothetical protein
MDVATVVAWAVIVLVLVVTWRGVPERVKRDFVVPVLRAWFSLQEFVRDW